MRRGARTVTIGGGTLRGRALRYPEGADVRPSMQRTKASLFSSLSGGIDGAVFADLYAGAGAVGIEALSRGARFVHFVERNREALAALRENLERCGIDPSRFRVHHDAVARVMEARLVGDATVVFADPPYDVAVADDLLVRVTLDAMPSLEWLVVEHRTRVVLVAPPGLSIERERRFGETTLTYFVPERGAAGPVTD